MAFRYGMGRGSYKSLPNLHCPVDMWHDVDEMEVLTRKIYTYSFRGADM